MGVTRLMPLVMLLVLTRLILLQGLAGLVRQVLMPLCRRTLMRLRPLKRRRLLRLLRPPPPYRQLHRLRVLSPQ